MQFYLGYPPVAPADVPGTLAGSAWASHILHSKLDRSLTDIFRITTAAVRRVRAASITEAEKKGFGEPLARGYSAIGDSVFE